MRLEQEFTFIADVMGQLLKGLQDGEAKQQLVAEVVAAMTKIEQDLGGVEQTVVNIPPECIEVRDIQDLPVDIVDAD